MNSELFRGKYRTQSIRLPAWAYSANGYYFVTLCTKSRAEYFGEIRNGLMGLNELGCVAAKFWQEIQMHFKNVTLDEWVIMPNHVHGIIVINTPHVETRHGASLRVAKFNRFGPLIPRSLSSIINHFKGAVTRSCRQNGFDYFTWQPLFYDRIIRNDDELYRIRKYIRNNPFKWYLDRNHPENLWM